jgi:hypothetical protein
VEKGKIIYTIDLRWTKDQIKNLTRLFNLDSALIDKVYKGAQEIIADSIHWKAEKITPHLVELSKNIDNKPISHFVDSDIFLLEDNWVKAAALHLPEPDILGVNDFINTNAFRYEKGIAHFYLPGFKNSKDVYLAGSFNNWSTLQTPMQWSDSGWISKLPLSPGKYAYKYIVDGSWILDPSNKHKENDGEGNMNSYLYCYNYLFKLKGYGNARKVILTGSFNNWDENDLKMKKTPVGWEFPLYLKEGTYGYKFIVDREWITDPENKDTRPDGMGNMNSYLGIGDAHIFRLQGFTSAQHVYLAGSFNNWNPGEIRMEKTLDGWTIPYILAPGNYEYKFIVDGKWMPDPANPHTTGDGDFTNSFFPFQANHTFTLNKFTDALQVIVTGNFNNWNTEGYRMVKNNGKWTLPIYLRPGKCLYKFIVDGRWITDPDNPLWEQNEYGTGNSVLWLAPNIFK